MSWLGARLLSAIAERLEHGAVQSTSVRMSQSGDWRATEVLRWRECRGQ
jgi:hypothetical protein